MSNAQKIPLSRSLNRLAAGQVNDAFQRTGQALPCSVVSVAGGIVTVKFEVNSKFTLPSVTIPLAGAEYIRYPIQAGCKGYVVPADARLAGMSGIGGGVADLSQAANLTALVFFPFANAAWFSVDPDAVVIYGPNGVVLRDTGNASNITLTPSGIAITTNEVTAKVPTTNWTGDMNLTGTLTVNGAIIGTSTITAPNIIGTTDVTFGAIDGTAHVHPIPGGDTGPPVG